MTIVFDPSQMLYNVEYVWSYCKIKIEYEVIGDPPLSGSFQLIITLS
jgi:hypothetical protein